MLRLSALVATFGCHFGWTRTRQKNVAVVDAHRYECLYECGRPPPPSLYHLTVENAQVDVSSTNRTRWWCWRVCRCWSRRQRYSQQTVRTWSKATMRSVSSNELQGEPSAFWTVGRRAWVHLPESTFIALKPKRIWYRIGCCTPAGCSISMATANHYRCAQWTIKRASIFSTKPLVFVGWYLIIFIPLQTVINNLQLDTECKVTITSLLSWSSLCSDAIVWVY